MIDKSKRIHLFSNCILVKGYKNCVICDLQRNALYNIDEDLFIALNKYNGNILDEILNNLTEEEKVGFISAIETLIDLELIILLDDVSNLVPINLEWDSPSHITNMIIEYGSYFNYSKLKLQKEINLLGVKFVELRFYKYYNLTEYTDAVETISNSKVRGIYLVIPIEMYLDIKFLLTEHIRVMNVLVYGAEMNYYDKELNVNFRKEIINDNSHCGIVHKDYFSVNLSMFTESMNYNNCLNRKLAITSDGSIKNCPSIDKVYGTIENNSLLEIINFSDFNLYWKIKKDTIEVCKDCEFRYVCTDCRAYIESQNNLYSKPIKCNYNPYKVEWDDALIDV